MNKRQAKKYKNKYRCKKWKQVKLLNKLIEDYYKSYTPHEHESICDGKWFSSYSAYDNQYLLSKQYSCYPYRYCSGSLTGIACMRINYMI
jgi:hypothetical protein